MYEDLDSNTPAPRYRRSSAAPIAIAVGIAALAGGFLIGGATVYATRAEPIAASPVERQLTDAEKEAIWRPKVAEATASVEEAHNRISALEDQVKDRENKVASLEAEMARRHAGGVALQKQLDAARAELADVKQQLQVALADKDRLTGQLNETTVALDKQREATHSAVQNTMEQKWSTFVAQTKLEVCEKGTRNKLSNCRTTVDSGLNQDIHQQFLHCLRAGQEAPTVREVTKEQASIPQFTAWIDKEEKTTRDWYVQLCDPSLPEAKDLSVSSSDVRSHAVAQGT